MQNKFKTLGLAVAALLAMSAVSASAAQAQFTANVYPATVTATSPLGNDVLTIDGSAVECATHYQGSLSEASTTLTMTATYTNCKMFGFASGTINMNGCQYRFHDTGVNTAGKFSIVCPVGKSIITTVGNCEVQIGEQGPLSAVTFANAHPNVTFKANVSGITVNKTKDGFFCPFAGTGHTTATYVQAEAVTLKPVSGGNTISVH